MTVYDALYHTDPETCPYTEPEHRFRPWSGLCDGHPIARAWTRPACICANDTNGPCPQLVTDDDEAPYCTDCYTVRVYAMDARRCDHMDPGA